MQRITLCLLSILVLFNSCSNDKDEHALSSIIQNQSLFLRTPVEFKFDKFIVHDSIRNRPIDDLDYLTFTPAMTGYFKWVSKRKLLFVPDSAFKPNTNYKINFNERLLQEFDTLESFNPQFHEIDSREFELEDIHTQWQIKNGGQKDQLTANIEFSYPLLSTDIISKSQNLENLVVEMDGKKVDFMITSSGLSEKISLDLKLNDAMKYQGKKITFTLKKGTKVYNTNWHTPNDISKEVTLPDLSHLKIDKYEIGIEDNQTIVKFYTNQSIAKLNKLDTLTKINPTVEIKAEITSYGFKVIGNFKPGEKYNFKILKELESIYKKTMEEDAEFEISFENIQASISFSNPNKIYLSTKGEENLALNIIGVESIKVTIHRIYDNKTQNFLSAGRRESVRWNSREDRYISTYYYRTSENGDKVYEQDFKVENLATRGNTKLFNFNFKDVLGGHGIYVIGVSANDHPNVSASQMISNSDIGLIVKKHEEDLVIFANSIKTTQSLAGVNIEVVSTKNQRIFSGSTDQNGKIVIKDLDKKNPVDVYPDMIVAKKGADVNYVKLDYRNVVNQSDFDTRGVGAREDLSFFYGDRDLYRPGDEVILAGIIRDRSYNVMKDIPITVKINSPTGKTFKEFNVTTGKEGEFSYKLLTQQSFLTGQYSANYYLYEDNFIGSYSFKIEEFMPERLKVKVSTEKDEYAHTDSIQINGSARNLFGTPAKNRKYEVEVNTNAKNMSFPKHKRYNFRINMKEALNNSTIEFSGTTDDEGKFEKNIAPVFEFPHNGAFESTIHLTVFDENGRPVSNSRKVDVLSQSEFVGIKYPDYYNDVNKEISFDFIVVDSKGKALDKKQVDISIIQYKWESVLERNSNGYYRYKSYKHEHVIEENVAFSTKKGASFKYTPDWGGSYELRMKVKGQQNYVKQSFYVYNFNGWNDFSNNSFEIDPKGRIQIELDKENYDINEKAKVLFKTPFDGKMLVTLERDGVYFDKYINTQNKKASLEIDIKDKYLPNVFVSAILFKKLDNGSLPLTVAYGYKAISVRKKSNKIKVSIDAPEKIRSNQTQKVKIKTSMKEKNVKVTLAAVDEGILQITNYKSPDPYNFFYQNYALNVLTYNIYPYLFPDLKAVSKNMGGGDDEMLDEMTDSRSNPLANKRVKLLALWSGVVNTNEKGECDVDLKIPQYSGSVRLMAVAHKGQAFGSAEKDMIVADPIVISPSIPRFLSPGDKLKMDLTISNTKDNNANAEVKVKVGNGLVLTSDDMKKVTITANDEMKLEFEIEAEDFIGATEIDIEVKAHGESFKHHTDITVRPTTAVARNSGSGYVEPGKTKELDLNGGFIPGTVSSRIVIGRSPLLSQTNIFDDLIRYPYGCVEQTTSKLFPQLYFAELLEYVAEDNKSAVKEANRNLKAGISKLINMQTPSGGIAYWRGGYDPHWWGSCYASHFLIEAKKKGYNIPDRVLNDLYDYLEDKLYDNKYTNRSYYEDNRWVYKKRIRREIAYSLYVLSLAGKVKESDLSNFKKELDTFDEDSKFLLAAAYYLNGDLASFKEIVPKSYDAHESKRQLGGSFHSSIRAKAISLLMLIETKQQGKLVDDLTEDLLNKIASVDYLSTQEMGFALLALGKQSEINKSDRVQGEIVYNGKSFKLGKDASKLLKLDGDKAVVRSTGEGRLYYYWQTKGLPELDNVEQGDSKIFAKRAYLTKEGDSLTTNIFKQGDLIMIKLTVGMIDEEDDLIENIALTDMLPACFEIENPRLTNKRTKMQNSEYSFMDPRDDRMNFFLDLEQDYEWISYYDEYGDWDEFRRWKHTKTYYYLVRAVSKGTYKSGSISADAMYDGSYRSYHLGGEIIVE